MLRLVLDVETMYDRSIVTGKVGSSESSYADHTVSRDWATMSATS